MALASLMAVTVTTASEIDPTKLPPPASVTTEFDRDIKPIFEKSCFRCHGPERPRSHFRLDNREAALKGGDNHTDDIVPGDSAKSRLVHNVARLVEDMEMPPPGKGEPLTPEQIGLLRAWIDQGANWGATNQVSQSSFSISPTLHWISVRGDERKFRELEGVK
ncbi:MAG: c-type cytochrome domain-containing protein, partial [Verrucomicrobiota bacterium]